MLPLGIKGLDLLSRVEPPTGTKGGPFVRVGGSTRDKKPLSPTLARLAVGPETKDTFYPGPKDNRDKWPETKDYSVVVDRANNLYSSPSNLHCFYRLGLGEIKSKLGTGHMSHARLPIDAVFDLVFLSFMIYSTGMQLGEPLWHSYKKSFKTSFL